MQQPSGMSGMQQHGGMGGQQHSGISGMGGTHTSGMQQPGGVQGTSGMQPSGQYESETQWSHEGQPSYGHTTGTQQQPHATVGEKIRGGAEKMAGKMTGKPGMVEKGQERQAGVYHGQQTPEEKGPTGYRY